MNTLLALEGKKAVITGGGRGIGAACAAALAEAGAAVVVAARSESEIGEVATELRAAGHQAWPIACDVGDETSVQELADAATERLGSVDILVNNAGVARSAPLHHQTLEEWEMLLRVNATGTFLCTRAFAPGMAEQKWGRILNMASVAGRTGAKYIGAYAASKHAVVGFTRCVAAELAESGVTVNAVCPGYVDTDMTEESIERIVERTGLAEGTARDSVLAMNPQGRLIEAAEVAHVVLALCDENAKGITGQAIGIDGGKFLG